MTYDFFEMRDLITVAHRGDAKVDAKPCEVSIDIRGEECLSRPRGGCHGPDGEFRVVTSWRILVTTRNSHRARDNRRNVPISTYYPECRSKPHSENFIVS
ncbi:Uncharacterized protein TCM_027864 [Theobroma cacao]|uniref:Uncharacterized protein n=1 Tax=Theobroma cacao TaxID=3641 RepID=A0A061G919_THECC|nr:Uncharacterized protein TCM_027864 [Theobroma cacao]